MPLRNLDQAESITVLDRWDGGMSWVAHPDEGMHRTSHALRSDGDLWLVDPVDGDDLDDRLADLGTVAGVTVLTNSHGRHADRVADRHGVAIHCPACFTDRSIGRFDAPVERFDATLGDTDYGLVWETGARGWQEAMLYSPDRRTLVVSDALVTGVFTRREGTLELFPMFKFSPPREALEGLAIDRILLGHGPPVTDDPEGALAAALDVSRLEAVTGVIRNVPTFARIFAHQARS